MSGRTPEPPDQFGRQRSRASLIRLGLFGVVALLIASTLPPQLMIAALSSFLWVGGLVSGLVAAFRAEPIGAPHLTRWDEAAVLMLASLAFGFFVDPQDMAQHLERLRQ